jgi:hypothetical protein
MARNPERTGAELERIEETIRAGRMAEARAALARLTARKPPRPHAATAAKLARLCDWPEKAISLLQRTVRPSARSRAEPTPAERCEYAGALVMVGALREGEELLRQEPLFRYERHAFILGDCLHTGYRYAEAVPLFERARDAARKSSPLEVGSRVSLGEALTRGTGKLEDASSLLADATAEARARGMVRLEFRGLLGLAENRFLAGDRYGGARAVRELDRDWSAAAEPSYRPLIEAWKALLDIKGEGTPADWRRVSAVRARLLEARRWEHARLLDLYVAARLGSRRLLQLLSFGTPHAAFRALARRRVPLETPLPASFDWRLGEKGRARFVLDVENCMRPGHLPQRLLRALASDFYKPMTLFELHEAVYPGEHYLLKSTPDRTHQGLRWLRRWLADEKVPLRVDEAGGFYRLAGRPACVVRVASPELRESLSASRTLTAAEGHRLRAVERAFAGRPFSVSEASRALAISSRSALRVLTRAAEEGVLDREGAGPATRYRVVPRGR